MSAILTKEYIKSPLNYVGGKHKLLPQILPLFPENIGTFVDLFAGGCDVAVNVDAKVTCINDREREVIHLIEYIYSQHIDELLAELDGIIMDYGLSKTNKEGYLRLRDDFNRGAKSPLKFYALVTHAFNNLIRFNRKGEFNMSFGANRSYFNPSLREKFILFKEALDEKTLSLTSDDFRDYEINRCGTDVFVYCDPPYLISTAPYNEQNGWTETDERDLLALLDLYNKRGIKFALSNVLEHKNRHNTILAKWAENYNVHDLKISYANAICRSTNRDAVTREVLITNY